MNRQFKDITGQRFGWLSVVGMAKKGHVYHAVCKCECGVSLTVNPRYLRKGKQHCGCLPRARKPPLVDLVGQRFGHLEVLAMEQAGKTSSGERTGTYYAVCRCLNCGREGYPVLPAALRRRATTSCGCRRDQYTANTGELNAQFRGYKEIRAKFWNGYIRGAKDRDLEFTLTMEYAWELFEQQNRRCALSGVPLVFRATARNKLTTASIDRMDSSQGYIPGNVQWVHKRINLMKGTLSVQEFVGWCSKVVNGCQLPAR